MAKKNIWVAECGHPYPDPLNPGDKVFCSVCMKTVAVLQQVLITCIRCGLSVAEEGFCPRCKAHEEVLQKMREFITPIFPEYRNLSYSETFLELIHVYMYKEGESPDPESLASMLLRAVGGKPTTGSFLAPTASAHWEGKCLVVSPYLGEAGRWIGKGGQYIKRIRHFMQIIGGDIRLEVKSI